MTTDEPNREAYHLTGDRLGAFVILSELGRGSMGVVYEALNEDLKRKVALKVLPANISLDEKQVRRFHREAESVARLRHENIIQIHEVGQIGNTHYFAMELVDGAQFRQVSAGGRAGIREAARLARDAARGLAHAHERGVIHRDIKPGNLLVDRAGRVVLTDFGLARLSESASLTSTDAIVGTPKYMSPEQILVGKFPLDGRTDIYSLGATLYHVLTGRPPIEEPSVQAFLRAIIEERPPSPRRFNKEIPHDLATIILRCLEKDPVARYASASDLADDIDRFLAGERILAKPKGAVAIGYELVRRHRIITALAAVALIAALVGFWESSRARSLKTLEDVASQAVNLLSSPDVDLAIEEAEFLAREWPDYAPVQNARRTLYLRRARERLKESEAELYSEGVIRDLEEARLTGTWWHLVMLFEAGRYEAARRQALKLPENDVGRELTLARLELRAGDEQSAIERLEPVGRAEDADPLVLLVLSQAHGAAAARADPSDPDQAAIARETLQRAYDASRSIEEQWLRDRIFVRKLADFQGEPAAVADLLPSFGGMARETFGRLSEIWVDMSETESEIVREFISRILHIADVPAQARATRVLTIARQRLSEAKNDRERILANLLLAAYHLGAGLPGETEKDLDAAANVYDSELMPYVYWGMSLAERARGDIKSAIQDALLALETAGALESFGDLRFLALHTTLLAEEAEGSRQGNQARKAARLLQKELEASEPAPEDVPWVSDLLERARSLGGASIPPR